MAVSRLAEECPEIVELDLNPIRVFEKGLMALDARAKLG
jgi:acyl-CoA synthetase (NDP forming)